LGAELADWKCRLDDALRLVDSRDLELRRAATQHLADVDRWSSKVEQLVATNSELEASEARTKRELADAEARENLLRKNVEELNSQLEHQEQSTAQMRDQINSQLSRVQERLCQVENCLESKELERTELEKSYDMVQSALRETDDEKSQLILTLTEVFLSMLIWVVRFGSSILVIFVLSFIAVLRGVVGRLGPGKRQIVGIGDCPTAKGNFGDLCGASRCNQ